MEEKLAEVQSDSMEEQIYDSRPPRRAYRSLFWPIVLVGVGVIWLLMNLGIIQNVGFWGLLKLWPLLLVFIGLDILVGRQLPALGALIGLAVVGLVIFLMVFGPSWGWLNNTPRWFYFGPGEWVGDVEVQTAYFEEAVDGATSADVELNTALWPVTVEALPAGSDNLIEADIAYVGEPIFDVDGGQHRSITIGMEEVNVTPLSGTDWGDHSWEVGLSPDVPIDLSVNSGIGDNVFDLSGLQLTGLAVNGGLGAVDVFLPAADSAYDTDFNLGAGDVTMTIADEAAIDMSVNGGFGSFALDVGEDADVELSINMGAGDVDLQTDDGTNVDATINGGFGAITVDVPNGAGVRLVVENGGFGDVNVPGNFVRVAEGDDSFLDNEGIWESPNFSSADYQVIITINSMGAGDVTVRQ